MKTTYSELNEFVGAASQYLQEKTQRSKLTYAIEAIFKESKKHLDDYQVKLNKIAVTHAIEKDGVLLTEPDGRFKYSKEGIELRRAAEREIGRTEIEIKDFIVPCPKELSVSFQSVFEGFVIPITEPPEE